MYLNVYTAGLNRHSVNGDTGDMLAQLCSVITNAVDSGARVVVADGMGARHDLYVKLNEFGHFPEW